MRAYRSQRGQYDEGETKHLAFLTPDLAMKELYDKGNALIDLYALPNGAYLDMTMAMDKTYAADELRDHLLDCVMSALARNTIRYSRAARSEFIEKIFALKGRMPAWKWFTTYPVLTDYLRSFGFDGFIQKNTNAKYKVVICQINMRGLRKIPRS